MTQGVADCCLLLAYHINVGRGTMTHTPAGRGGRLAYHINVGRGTMTQ